MAHTRWTAFLRSLGGCKGDVYMRSKELLCQWVDAFNGADAEAIADLYDDKAINHQVANEPVIGKAAIRTMFE